MTNDNNYNIYHKTTTTLPNDIIPLFTSAGVDYDERETLKITGRFTSISTANSPILGDITVPEYKLNGINNCGTTPTVTIEY